MLTTSFKWYNSCYGIVLVESLSFLHGLSPALMMNDLPVWVSFLRVFLVVILFLLF